MKTGILILLILLALGVAITLHYIAFKIGMLYGMSKKNSELFTQMEHLQGVNKALKSRLEKITREGEPI